MAHYPVYTRETVMHDGSISENGLDLFDNDADTIQYLSYLMNRHSDIDAIILYRDGVAICFVCR